MTPRKVVAEKLISTSEARRILERAKKDELGEFQRRTLDYATKFSKLPASKAEKLVLQLSEKLELEKRDAIQVVNCLPKTVEELRSILTVRGRVFVTQELEEIVKILSNHIEK